MNIVVTTTVSLLVVATIVALIARRLALPYTVGLVVTGTGLALTRNDMGVVLTHEFIFDVILPPLLFESAINLHWKDLRRDALPILTLALIGTIVSAGTVTTGMVLILGWRVVPALLFAILIAATDPVAVIAMFKDNGVEGRLRLFVESESLFNDGVAAVFFSLVLVGIQTTDGQAITSTEAARVLLFTVGGGIFVGIACAGGAMAVADRASDHLIESTLTTTAAYGSFLVAEHFHFSGVLATVAAGLLLGTSGCRPERRAAGSP
jgi:monovalent cation:H+ antiporter, CPA1 family